MSTDLLVPLVNLSLFSSPSPSPIPKIINSTPIVNINSPLFLTIDGGGTKTTVLIGTFTLLSPTASSSTPFNDGNLIILSRFTSISSNYSDKGLIKALEAIKLGVEGGLNLIGITLDDFITSGRHFESVWAGLAGVDDKKGIKEMKEGIEKILGIDDEKKFREEVKGKGKGREVVEITNDCELLASEISASGKKKGVVLICGTGSIGLAFNSGESEGTMKCIGRAGGHGYILGDEGSGFWVGREAIRRILQLIDEKSPVEYEVIVKESILIQLVLRTFNVTRIEDLLSAVYTSTPEESSSTSSTSTSTSIEHSRKLRISSLSRIVQATAYPSFFLPFNQLDSSTLPTPDPISISILELASTHLQSLLTKLCTATKIIPSESTLVLGTGLWTCVPFRELFIDNMKKSGIEWKEIRIVGINEGGPEGVALKELVRRWRVERGHHENI